jgi:hypothetical protein
MDLCSSAIAPTTTRSSLNRSASTAPDPQYEDTFLINSDYLGKRACCPGPGVDEPRYPRLCPPRSWYWTSAHGSVQVWFGAGVAVPDLQIGAAAAESGVVQAAPGPGVHQRAVAA